MNAFAIAGSSFVREHLRTPLTLLLLIAIPALFVLASAAVLGDFARALGGTVAGQAATALGAGWAAAFLAGVLGFFQVASSREADRRLSLAGLGPTRVAAARISAALVLGLVVSAAAFLSLLLRTGVEHPAHAAVAIFAFAAIYIGIGAIVGSLVSDPLEGSILVAFVFMFDVFSGPAMTSGGGLTAVMPTRKAADLLIAAGAGQSSPLGDWFWVALIAAISMSVAFTSFWAASRSRGGP